MSKRFGWLLGLVVLVSIGLLVACGTNYNATSDGLVVVGSQGSAALQTFSFNLGNGSIAGVYNSTAATSGLTCLLPGLPSSIVLDPAGAYAYTIITANSACPGSTTGILAFKVNSDGTMKAVGSPVPLTAGNQVCVSGTLTTVIPPLSFPVGPVALSMDSKGKFLFVADGVTTDTSTPPNPVPGAISVFSIGAGGSLTEVTNPATGTPFAFPPSCSAPADPVALAVSPTVFPSTGINAVQGGVCSDVGNNPPTSEFLYVADASNNNAVWEFGVNTSTGALTNPPSASSVLVQPAGETPAGVAVDPCDRFVYVANNLSNNVSAYTICNGLLTQPASCPQSPLPPDGSLQAITGSPFSVSGSSSGLGPLLVDPYGNTLYVVATDASMISIFRIAPISGKLTAGNPATVATGAKPTSIAIRSDNSWLFVTNYNAGTLSQYAITPATGALSPTPVVTTDNYPWGVAVK